MGIKSRTFDIPNSTTTITNGHTNNSISSSASAGLLGGGGGDKQYRVKLTEQERKKVEELIRNAKSLQEITRLEREINEGRIPS